MTTTERKCFTCQDADRLLGLADQFLEDWENNEGTNGPECIDRRAEWNSIRPLLAAAPTLLAAYQDMAEIVEAYLVHKDVSDAAFSHQLKRHIAIVSQLADAAAAPHVIRVEVQGGLVSSVSGIPAGCELHVEDYDEIDPDNPRWDPDRECVLAVYEGGAA